MRTRYSLDKKDVEKELNFRNSLLLRKDKNTQKVVVHERELPAFWQKFHLDSKCGGHQGLFKFEYACIFDLAN